ncbi:MAG: PDC sensor domain-containing protein [Acidiferrobacterales bacterium]
MMVRRGFLLLLVATFTAPAAAQELAFSPEQLKVVLAPKIMAVKRLAANLSVVDAVKAQNAEETSIEQIKQIDEKWRATKTLTAFKRSLQRNPAGRFLRRHVRRNPTYGEAFLTDKRGANVAAYPATSDYWQGDETKFTASYDDGKGQVFVGDVEYDESSQTHAAQVSVPVIDQGKAIGVLVMGVQLDYIAWKQGRGQAMSQ